MSKIYFLSEEDILILFNQINVRFKDNPLNTRNTRGNILNYLYTFETTQKELYGNWGNYNMENNTDFNGIYGYLEDIIIGHFKGYKIF
jgi:hypothetical protein